MGRGCPACFGFTSTDPGSNACDSPTLADCDCWIVSVATGNGEVFWADMLTADTNSAKNKKRNFFIDALPTLIVEFGSEDGKQNASGNDLQEDW